jgi:hypothetical protein
MEEDGVESVRTTIRPRVPIEYRPGEMTRNAGVREEGLETPSASMSGHAYDWRMEERRKDREIEALRLIQQADEGDMENSRD